MKSLMKIIYEIIALLVFLSTGANASALPLSNRDQTYVIAVTASSVVADQCKAKLIKDSAIRLADKTGIDISIIGKAIVAAVNASSDHPYERKDLIPEVTSTMITTSAEILQGIKLDRAKTCTVWIIGLRSLGMVE
jgi:hypothetical protein